jgi:hypothetical protein
MVSRLIRRIWALLWLALLLVGLPAGLIRLAGWPLPDAVPSRAQLRDFLAEPLTVQTVATRPPLLVGCCGDGCCGQ